MKEFCLSDEVEDIGFKILNLKSYTLIKKEIVMIGTQGELLRKDEVIPFVKEQISKDVKEFIRQLKELDWQYTMKLITFVEYIEARDKLAGPKLIEEQIEE